MVVIKIEICDNCKQKTKTKYLIYRIDFWNQKEFYINKKDYLLYDDIALMLCSEKCIGEYIGKLLRGDKC